MRLLIFLLIFLANPVEAVGPPGPPPWSCSVFTGCIDNGICDDVDGRTIYFNLSETTGENRFIVDGFREHQFIAETFPTLKEAKRFLRNEIEAKVVSMFLVHSNEISDSHGFRLHGASPSGSGKRFISEEYLLVGCNSQR